MIKISKRNIENILFFIRRVDDSEDDDRNQMKSNSRKNVKKGDEFSDLENRINRLEKEIDSNLRKK